MAEICESVLLTFQKWDLNGDGVISQEELTVVLSHIGLPSEVSEDLFRKADLDRDGVLNYSEFLSWIFSEEAPEAIRFDAASTTDVLSVEGTGKIDEDGGRGTIGSSSRIDGEVEEGEHGSDRDVVSPGIAWEEDLSLWPLGKLVAAHRASSRRSKNGNAVLLTTGAMNPVHRGHVQQLYQAKERLERGGYRVLAAWLSPSHDAYVQPKCAGLRTIGLSATFRLTLARRAVEEDDFVSVGAWEASKEGSWPDFPVVLKALQEELRRHHDSRGVQLFYVCGDDHFRKCGLHTGMRSGIGVVAVPRGGSGPAGRDKPDKGVFVARAADGEVAGYSSTKVRDALCCNDIEYVQRAISPGAARFLLQPSREEYAEFMADYRKLGVVAP